MSNNFLAALIALGLCLITAVSRIFLKKGLQDSNIITSMTFSLVLGCAILVSFALITQPLDNLNFEGVLFFSFIGMIAPPVVRTLTYIGVDRIGASRSDSIRSLTPFFAMFFAIIFLNESVSMTLFLAVVLIVFGALLLSKKEDISKWNRIDLLYPLLAAIIAGGIAILRKHGISLLPSPALAAAIAATSALTVYLLFLSVSGQYKKIKISQRSARFFFYASLFTGITDILDLVILKLGKVSTVSPMLAASPLFVILLSHLFLRDLEKVTRKVWIGGFFIFLGMQMVLFSA